jgi:hypothetical protein
MKACYEVVPPRMREQRVADLGLCRDVRHVETCLPVRRKVEVTDTATALVPAYQPTCVPKIGYAEVQDFRDKICPRWECRCVPKTGVVTEVRLGVGWGTCGPAVDVSVCKVCRGYAVVEPVVAGPQLLSLPCGSHLEQVQDGCKCVPIHVGADRVRCVTGSHVEDRIVGYAPECIEVDRGVRVRERGAWSTCKETQPWRYQLVERPCHVPGFWAYVVDEAPAVREPGVVTRAEYEELMRDVAKSAAR